MIFGLTFSVTEIIALIGVCLGSGGFLGGYVALKQANNAGKNDAQNNLNGSASLLVNALMSRVTQLEQDRDGGDAREIALTGRIAVLEQQVKDLPEIVKERDKAVKERDKAIRDLKAERAARLRDSQKIKALETRVADLTKQIEELTHKVEDKPHEPAQA